MCYCAGVQFILGRTKFCRLISIAFLRLISAWLFLFIYVSCCRQDLLRFRCTKSYRNNCWKDDFGWSFYLPYFSLPSEVRCYSGSISWPRTFCHREPGSSAVEEAELGPCRWSPEGFTSGLVLLLVVRVKWPGLPVASFEILCITSQQGATKKRLESGRRSVGQILILEVCLWLPVFITFRRIFVLPQSCIMDVYGFSSYFAAIHG